MKNPWNPHRRRKYSANSAEELVANRKARRNNVHRAKTAKKVEDRLNQNLKGKEWRPIRGYESLYVATDKGEIIRLKSGRIMKQNVIKDNGYLIVGLSKPRELAKSFVAHRLICRAFHGEPPTVKPEVNHKNFIKIDNRPENLEWCSRQENLEHAWAADHKCYGERVGNSKLTQAEVDEIRKIGRSLPAREVAKKFNVVKTTIQKILSGHTWRK